MMFGVSFSPFLLNATINHYLENYRYVDPSFVDKFLSSVYVDDVSVGVSSFETVYELYSKSKLRLAEVGFRLRKFVTNSDELRDEITPNEKITDEQKEEKINSFKEEDQSYATCSLGQKPSELTDRHKILGVELVFDVGNVSRVMGNLEPTKRNVVGSATRFYDPLGIVSPVTVSFKVFFQQLCEQGLDWDQQLTGALLEKWSRLLSLLQNSQVLHIPRCYLTNLTGHIKSTQLIGFCDASAKPYAAAVYLRIETETEIGIRLDAAKTRVSPLSCCQHYYCPN